MFESQRVNQAQTDRAQTIPVQKPTSSKHHLQRVADPARLPLYTRVWGNQPPPWLHLSTSRQASTEQPLQRHPSDVAAQLGSTALPGHYSDVVNVYGGAPMNIQPKLTVGPGHDQYEQEADHIAEQVMQMSVLSPDQQALRLNKKSDEDSEAGADIESRVAASKGGGRSLPDALGAFMELRFGADFSGVRLHTGSEASQLNGALGARAFTQGRDIYLGEGEDNLTSSEGKQLLAHELTHTIQQGAVSLKRQVGLKQDYTLSAAASSATLIQRALELSSSSYAT